MPSGLCSVLSWNEARSAASQADNCGTLTLDVYGCPASQWTLALGQDMDMGAEAFDALLMSSPVPIVKRLCPGCGVETYKEIYCESC